jgi:hypothetical protein
MRKLEAEIAAEDEAKQKTREIAAAVLTLLDARGIAVDDETRGKIRDSEDAGELRKWLVNAATAASVDDVFGNH